MGGKKKKTSVTDTSKCLGAASSCEATCCEADTTLCGGNTVTCGADKYQDPTKAGTAKGSDAVAACCTAVATCSSVTCSAGKKKKTSVTDTTKCLGAASGCEATCCEADTTLCGGNTVTCGADKYQDSTKAGTAKGSDAVAACCTAKATCSQYFSHIATASGAV